MRRNQDQTHSSSSRSPGALTLVEKQREKVIERAAGCSLLEQRQPSDYFLPKLTMTLTTAGVQQIPYSPCISTRALCAPINQQMTTRPEH